MAFSEPKEKKARLDTAVLGKDMSSKVSDKLAELSC